LKEKALEKKRKTLQVVMFCLKTQMIYFEKDYQILPINPKPEQQRVADAGKLSSSAVRSSDLT